MKILFKNITTYSENEYKKFLKFHTKKFGYYYTFTSIVTLILILFCVIISIKYKNFNLCILFIFAFVSYLIYSFFYPIKKIEKELNSDKISNSQTFTFVFYKYYFKIIGHKRNLNFPYFKLYKIFETKDFFYLYSNKNHSFALSKNGFKIGNSKNFSKFITKKCLFKFKKDNK